MPQVEFELGSVLKQWKLAKPVERCIHSLAKTTPKSLIKSYVFSYEFKPNNRFTTCAGLTRYSQRLLELNHRLLKPGREKERNETLLHELAHVLAYRLYRHHGHGEPWQDIMRRLGISDPYRYHEYSFLRSSYKKHYIYECKDCGFQSHRSKKIHKEGKLHLWYHAPCLKRRNKGRYRFLDRSIH